jgi:5-methyltetrahydrofolate--homocysteine methyltransferase
MLMGSEIGAALTALEPLGIDAIGLNCATGPAEMSEHLRHLSRHSRIPVSCMPNAGLPVLTKGGAAYPLSAQAACGRAHAVRQGVRALPCRWLLRYDARPPRRGRQGGWRIAGPAAPTPTRARRRLVVLAVPFRQETSFLSIGERTNANGSKAFKEAMLASRWDECVDIARNQTKDGAHLLDVCIDYVGRDGVQDMREIVSRFATSSTLPLVLDSTEPAVVEAGLELLGGRAVVNSVNYEDGEGEGSRFARIMPVVKEHGAAVIALTIDETGQARTREHKVAVAARLITALTGEWAMTSRTSSSTR